MAYLLAMASAALYGGADFLGGLGSRRAGTIAIVVLSQAAGLLALLVFLPLLPASAPAGADVAWGACAGLAGGVGVALLYRALAVGTMAVVAPITAVCAVIIPVVAGLLAGERLAGLTALGIVAALVAIVLVSQESPGAHDGARTASGRVVPPGVGVALIAGVAIGFFYLALARTSPAAGLWPLVAARVVSVTVFGGLAVLAAVSVHLPPPALRMALAAGILDITANALYLVATRYGALSVVVTLASLYPASTVLLARVVLGERLTVWQITGVGGALAAIVLIVAGDVG